MRDFLALSTLCFLLEQSLLYSAQHLVNKSLSGRAGPVDIRRSRSMADWKSARYCRGPGDCFSAVMWPISEWWQRVCMSQKSSKTIIINKYSIPFRWLTLNFWRLRSKTYQDSIKVTERCQEVVRWLVIPCERRTYPPEGCQNRIQFCMINFFFTQFLIKMTHMLKGKQLVVWSKNQMVIEIWPKSETQTLFGQFKSWFQVVNDAAHPNHNQDLCEAVNISYCSWK